MDLPLIINNLVPLLLGLIIGLAVGLSLAKTRRSTKTLANSSNKELQNEILEDQVKQLEAKIKTLEKALEMTR